MKSISTVLLAATMLSSSAFAGAIKTPKWLDVSGSVNFDVNGKDSNDFERNYRVQDAELRFEVVAREGIKAVVRIELEKQLQELVDDRTITTEELDQELKKMIEEAYIEIETDKVSGLPRAIITVGKHRMAFGTRLTQLPMFKDGQLYNLLNEEEMLGLTVTLPANFFGIVDQVALSLYETGAGDFEISDDKAVSIKASKALSRNIEMAVSGLLKQHGTADKESRAAVGFVFTSNDGRLQLWSEGVVMKNNPQYADARYAATVGAAMKLGAGAIVVEGSLLEKNGQEVAAAYNLPVGSWLVLSPEVRLTRTEAGDKDTTVGIRARLAVGKNSSKRVGPRG